MKAAAIVTDTNSGISAKQARAMGISLIPMPFFVNGEQHLEGQSCLPEEFFAALAAGAEVSTSQPAPGEIVRLWESLLEEHEAVLHFPMSSGLSGSCQTARALAADYPGRVFVVDNQRISVTLEQSIRDAQALLAAGLSPRAVHETLERESRSASIYIAVNTLTYLKKSGRVTAAGAAMATVLNLKPVLQIQGEKLDAFKKARGMQQAKQILLDAIRRDLEVRFAGQSPTLLVSYSGLPEEGERWLAEVQAAFPEYPNIHMTPLPISICCHVGAGARAVACAKPL